ncbi:MAG: hypothetical protein OEO20_03425 [Gemmatimonadota bacterium]|nr:hypothetical protein [Gemmatimonadota bacterium]MDH3367312.1 hypothetical protein [Gemmatimonadota bacterium]MDH3477335.1 hypothetical protein [Gemmatimonadota bacterium]MDH3568916.1 hypothetical protein [Gemmatimonadota bacterium]MDH5549652.1 hypothetical protein [Gemmatimonadota bacterium]
MTEGARFTRPGDPLFRRVPLDHGVEIAVVGVAVRFESNSEAVVRAVTQWFQSGRAIAPTQPPAGEMPVRVTVVVHGANEGTAAGGQMTYRMPDRHRVFVHTAGSFGVADTARGDAIAYVTEALVEDEARFMFGVVEMLTLVLVTARDRYPIHAAMLYKDGVSLLLAAPSGRGKSTVAYQAHLDGWHVVADDGVYIQTSPALRLWGRPGRLHLPVDAVRWFPQLADRHPEKLANGKVKILIEVRDGAAFSPTDGPVGVCLLERGGREASLERVSSDDLRAALLADLATANDLYGDAGEAAVARLATGGGWRVRIATNPSDVIPVLDRIRHEIAA